jgi:hypothetical protein
MAKKTVVIVARTNMYGGRVCIGSLSEDGENLRLMIRTALPISVTERRIRSVKNGTLSASRAERTCHLTWKTWP